jgi:thiamine biosynthesis lipoprotein
MKKRCSRLLLPVFFVLVLSISGISCNRQQISEYQSEEFLMDTLVSISTYGTDTDFLKQASEKAFSEIRRIADLTNRFPEPGTIASQTSDVVRINEMAGIKAVVVDEDVFRMLELAQEYNRLTEGAFDITIGPVMDLWGFGRKTQKIPTPEELQKVLALVDSRKLILNEKTYSAFLSQKGMSLDLGAMAKGYAVEKAVQILKEQGIDQAMVNAGGNIRVLGQKEEKKLWKVGIRDPRNVSALVGILSLQDESAVTSGDYNRSVQINGETFHHIISSQTGYPATHNMSVTVITQDSFKADLLSTVLFLLPPQKAYDLGSSLADTEVVIVTTDKRILYTPGLQGRIEITAGEEYRYDRK